jgi:hypothetical protein
MHLWDWDQFNWSTDLKGGKCYIVLVRKGEAFLPWKIMKAEERDRKALRSSVRSTTIRLYGDTCQNEVIFLKCIERTCKVRLEIGLIYWWELTASKTVCTVLCAAVFSEHLSTLKRSGYYMYRQVYHSKILRTAHRVDLCVLCVYQNKQRLFPYTTLTVWFL